MTKKGLILIVCLLVFLNGAFGLDIEEGRIKLVLHKGIGRFSLYYLTDAAGRKYVPFLLDQDPRTSVLSVIVGNKIHRMGEAGTFTEELEQTDTGAKFVWKSGSVDIEENFSFLTSKNSSLADGVQINVKGTNNSKRDIAIGFRFIFDTYLGEESGAHFKTESLANLDRELTFYESNMVEYWVSSRAETDVGLKINTKGNGISTPSSLVFANWKRLNEASWEYETSSTRNFNLLPYSINDSAVSHYYPIENVSPGGTVEVTLILSNVTANELRPLTSVSTVTTSGQESSDGQERTSASVAVSAELSTDLQALEKLLEEISRSLEGQSYSAEEVDRIEKAVDALIQKYAEE